MLLYSINVLWIIVGAIITKVSKNLKNSRIFFYATFMMLVLTYALRSYNVGWDSLNYVDVFASSNSIQWNNIFNHWMEFGYIALNKVVRYFTDNYNFLWLIIGLIILIPIFKIISRYSQNIMFSLLIYITLGFYYNGMNQIRQAIATSICLYAFDKIINKEYGKSILITLIASCFHSSAIIFLAFILAAWKIKDVNIKCLINFSVITLIVFMFSNPIINFATKFMYSQYFTESNLIKHTKHGDLSMFIVYFAIMLFGFIYRKRYIKTFESHKKVYDMLLLAIIFSVSLQLISVKLVMIARFSQYFTIYSCILIPNIIKCIKNEKFKLVITYSILLCLMGYSYIYLNVSENGYGRDGVTPYQFYWEV
ncbi:polysaccharide polymerase [[Clostridium] sordellii]|uniref:EpsG family protein n=1 Tax=Paraclostridium sordellii TaxID=1505 RepID=UPI0005DC8D09|nr:EpsG family protein [Paeniclostridium sordellii]CEN91459.1 polysaccharide polymerase [[Clostridium] sordellii] [Paeniclostridium sordellii]